jgi:RND family efflux transporter MFP subunit
MISRMKKIMKKILPGFIDVRSLTVLLAASLLAACGGEPEVVAEPPARPVKMMTIGDTAVKATWEYPGAIMATRNVDLGFEVAGKIIELPIEDGLKMKEGDLLGRLDPTDYEAARDAALANRRAMRSAYVRAKNIFNEGAGSQAEVDKTERDIKVAKQEVVKAQKALDDTTLMAPYDGVVGERIADNFQNVRAKEPILVFQDTSSLEMDVTVPERDFVRMEQGLTLEERTARARPVVEVSALPGRSFEAYLKSFTATADPVTRTYKATFAFENPEDVNILPGMTARVILNRPPEVVAADAPLGGIRIPAVASASDDQGNAYVWRIDPDSMRVSRVAVMLGQMSGADIQVSSGLSKGDRIAISGAAHLQEGMKVSPLRK